VSFSFSPKVDAVYYLFIIVHQPVEKNQPVSGAGVRFCEVEG
jgi:hypothetical protein